MNSNVDSRLDDFNESFEENKKQVSSKQNEKREVRTNSQNTKFMDRVILAEDGRQLLSE